MNNHIGVGLIFLITNFSCFLRFIALVQVASFMAGRDIFFKKYFFLFVSVHMFFRMIPKFLSFLSLCMISRTSACFLPYAVGTKKSCFCCHSLSFLGGLLQEFEPQIKRTQ